MNSHIAGLDTAVALTPRVTLPGAYGQIDDACFLANGRMAVRVAPYVYVADAASGGVLDTFLPQRSLSKMTSSLDGNVLGFVDSLGSLSTAHAAQPGRREPIVDARRFGRIALDETGARAIASYGNAAAIFDVRSGMALSDLRGHRAQPAQERGDLYDAASVVSIAISADGAIAVTGSTDGSAIVWDSLRGTALRVLDGHAGAVTSVAIDPAARTVATIDTMRVLRTWDTHGGKCLLRHAVDAAGAVAIAFDRPGERLAVLYSDGMLAIFTRHERASLAWWQPARAVSGAAPNDYETTLAFDASGASVLVAGPRNVAPDDGWFDDSCVRIVDVHTGAAREYRYGSGWASSPSVSPDGSTLVSGGVRAQRWTLDDGLAADASALPSTWQLAYAPEGRRLAAIFAGGNAGVLDDSGTTLVPFAPDVRATSLQWTPGGGAVVLETGRAERPFVVCDAATGAAIAWPAARARTAYSGFGNDGTFVSGDRDGLDAFAGGTWHRQWSIAGPIECCAFAPAASVFFSSDDRVAIAVREIATGKVRSTIDVGERAETIVAAPSGTWFVTSSGCATRVWSVRHRRVVATLDGLIEMRNLSIAFSSNERCIAVNAGSVRDFGSVTIFDVSAVARAF